MRRAAEKSRYAPWEEKAIARGKADDTARALVGVLALALLAGLTALVLPAAAPSPSPAAESSFGPSSGARSAGNLSATVRRDENGIPYITAGDYEDLGFGYGYAFAEDNICRMAETYLTVNAERSRYDDATWNLGPNRSYTTRGNGATQNNQNSDYFYQRIIDDGRIEDILATPPPQGPRSEIKEGVRGYVAPATTSTSPTSEARQMSRTRAARASRG